MPKSGPHNTVRRPGFTLVEAAVASGAAAVLMAALGSVLTLSARTMPGADDVILSAAATRRAILNMNAEIAEAIKVTQAKPIAIEFQVADRDSDGNPDVISYAWSGVSGDPLVRTARGMPTNIVEGVTSLSITYNSVAGTVPGAAVSTESGERLLAWYHADTSNYTVLTNTIGTGQLFYPQIPENATSWKITRASLWMAQNGAASGSVEVDLLAADSAMTISARNMGSATLAESAMPNSAGWVGVTFASPGSLLPGEGVALVVKKLSASDGGKWAYQSSDVPNSTSFFVNSTGSWTVVPMRSYKFEAYGTFTVPVIPTTACQRLRSVLIDIRGRSIPGGQMQMTVSTPGWAVMP